jgi:hypothetical protein
MPRDIIRLVPNVPHEIALQFPSGNLVSGQYGEQMYFSLEGNRCIYLDLEPAAMIASLSPAVGEPFMIVKKTSGRKGERAEWDVYLRTERAGSPLEAKLRDSIMQAEGRKAAGSAPAPAAPSRGTGTYGPVAAPAAAARRVPVRRQYADAFALFLVDAGRATVAAERALSGESGGAVRFDSRDVAAIATSMFIAADKAGYLTWDGGQ